MKMNAFQTNEIRSMSERMFVYYNVDMLLFIYMSFFSRLYINNKFEWTLNSILRTVLNMILLLA